MFSDFRSYITSLLSCCTGFDLGSYLPLGQKLRCYVCILNSILMSHLCFQITGRKLSVMCFCLYILNMAFGFCPYILNWNHFLTSGPKLELIFSIVSSSAKRARALWCVENCTFHVLNSIIKFVFLYLVIHQDSLVRTSDCWNTPQECICPTQRFLLQ